jgi:hypothetical protein
MTEYSENLIRYCHLMQHALGFFSVSTGYRNFFAATPESDDDLDWKEMVKLGLAALTLQRVKTDEQIELNYYTVSKDGKKVLGLNKMRDFIKRTLTNIEENEIDID